MPLTDSQREVALVLAPHRTPQSHVAGGAVINRSDDSPRYSADLDLFHDSADRVEVAAAQDAATLTAHGWQVEWLLQRPTFQRATFRRGTDELKLEWCTDSAFRFFPVQSDPLFGYCLHPADLATNKVLALAGRAEIRDFIDILYLDQRYLSLAAICWAACGKDQGFTPWSLLAHAKRTVEMDRRGDHSTSLSRSARMRGQLE